MSRHVSSLPPMIFVPRRKVGVIDMESSFRLFEIQQTKKMVGRGLPKTR